jgi:CDP-4-dehydro-6-deoxyglucose reductase
MAHRVTLKPSGHTFDVPEGVTVLQAGLDAGRELPYSCRTGVCRTCRGKILEGSVDYGNVSLAYLSDGDRAQGYALLCQAKPLADLVVEVKELAGLHGIRPKIMPARVERVDKPAPDVAMLALKLPANAPFKFVPGQYLDVLLKEGKRRSYSIANAPSDEGVGALELHIRLTPGGLFTEHVFAKLQARDLLRFEGPLGTFYLREESAKPIVLLASGTGFAPIKAIVEHMRSKGIERDTTLYWGGRVERDLYLNDVAKAWAGPKFRYIPVLSDEKWAGRMGFVHRAVMEDFPDLSGHQVYACGAPIVIESARRDFSAQCGLPADEFYADSFITEADKAKA